MYCPFLCSGEDVARSEAAPSDARSWEAMGTSPWGALEQAELPVGFAAPRGQHILERIPGMCTAAVALAVQESQ